MEAKMEPKAVLPHFLKLILQTQAETKRAEIEAFAASQLEAENEEEACDEGVCQSDDLLETPNAIRNVTIDEVPKILPLSKQAKNYLKKEGYRRRFGQAEPLKHVTESLHRRWSRTIWRQELNNLQPAYNLPALILKQFRYVRDAEKTRIGPGTYDVHYYEIQKWRRDNLTMGQMTSCSPRFEIEAESPGSKPGPGAYGNPYDTYEVLLEKLKHPGRLPIFQSGPCNVRTVMAVKNRNPGPGEYSYKSFVEQILSKRTGLKGPYELYSAPRDVIPYGYFKTPGMDGNTLGPGQYNIRNSLKSELNNCCNNFKGKLAKTNRFKKISGERIALVAPLWPRSHQSPGPADYNVAVYHESKPSPNKYGFNQSSSARQIETTNYDMAPDKYRPEIADRSRKVPVGHGWESAFMSKTKRLDMTKVQTLEERIKGKNIPHFQKEAEVENLENTLCQANIPQDGYCK